MGKDRDSKGKFIKGNRASKKHDRLCGAYPFCKIRIDTEKYPNQRYCSKTCRQYAWMYRIRNNLTFLNKSDKKQENNNAV